MGVKDLSKDYSNVIILCIGTKRIVGDSVGPLIGENIKYLENEYIKIYGALENTINFNNAQIVHIGFKRDSDYIIEVVDEDTMIVDNNYLYNLYYVIDNNPVIKSGFVLIANEKATSHLIRLEEI